MKWCLRFECIMCLYKTWYNRSLLNHCTWPLLSFEINNFYGDVSFRQIQLGYEIVHGFSLSTVHFCLSRTKSAHFFFSSQIFYLLYLFIYIFAYQHLRSSFQFCYRRFCSHNDCIAVCFTKTWEEHRKERMEKMTVYTFEYVLHSEHWLLTEIIRMP